MAGITVKISGYDKTEYVDARTLKIRDELTSKVNSASFVFICNDIAVAPKTGEEVLIVEGTKKLFSGRILSKKESFLPPNLLKYPVECIDYTRDLDRKLIFESYVDQKGGDIIKDIITKYTTGFTTANVDDGLKIKEIAFDFVQVSEALTKIAEICKFEWYIDYDKDIHFFNSFLNSAPFQLDDDQANYKDLIINTDISQLRNRIFIKSSRLKDAFGEVFIADGIATSWICRYRAEIMLPTKLDTETLRWNGTATEFSHNDIYLAMGLDFVFPMPQCPDLRIYKRDGDTFAKIGDPDVLPTGNAFGVAWSSDDVYLAVGHEVSPRITIYKRDGDVFTKLDNPVALPADDGNGLSFGYNDTYLAISHKDSPYITIYKRAEDIFTKLPNPANLPTGDGQGASFSPDGIYLAVAHAASPYITIYKRTNDTFTKLPDPADPPTGDAHDVAFSPDGIYLAVGHTTTPFITIYERDGDTFTKLNNPAELPAGLVSGVAFAPNSTHLATAHNSSPYMTLYKRGGDTFVKTNDLSPLPTGDGLSAAFSYNNRYIAIGHKASPRLTIYKHTVPLIMIDGVYKTVGWDGIDNPLYFDFMLNDKTKVLSIGAAGTTMITMGNEAIDRSASYKGHYTNINLNNPANASGKIKIIDIFAGVNMADVEIATFFNVGGNNYSTRDTAVIGTVIAGSKQRFSVDLDVVEGDFIGLYWTTGELHYDCTGEVGIASKEFDHIPCVNQEFTPYAGYVISIKAMGGVGEGELTVGSEILISYTAPGVPICFKRDDEDSIAAVAAIEGGDGIIEFCLVDNNIDSIIWANEIAKADLLLNTFPTIRGTFITNRDDIHSGQVIVLSSTKRNINQQFIIQSIELIRIDVLTEWPTIPYKPAAEAKIGYKPAIEAEIPYRAAGDSGGVIYYIFNVTIANKFKKLEDLFIYLLGRADESVK